MKTISLAILAVLVMSMTVFDVCAQDPAARPHYESVPFCISFLGTRHRVDIETVVSNIKKSPRTKKFVPSVISQQNVRYCGVFEGRIEELSFDITSLSTNRFSVAESPGPEGSRNFILSRLKNTSYPEQP